MINSLSTLLLYFNSTLSQSMAALSAILGVFFVYRLQAIDNKLRQAYDSCKNFFFKNHQQYLNGNTALMWLDKDVIYHLNAAARQFQINWPDGLPSLKDYKTQIESQVSKKELIIKNIRLPISLMFIIFVVSIACIPFSNILGKSDISFCIYITLILILLIYTIYLTVRYVFLSIQDPLESKINAP